MTESLQLVKQALAAGQINNGLAMCARALGAKAAGGTLRCLPLVRPEDAASLDSISEISIFEEPARESLAQLTDGLLQWIDWRDAFQPRTLRLFRIRNCTVLHPNVVITEENSILDDNVGFASSDLPDHALPGFPGVVSGSGHMIVRLPEAPPRQIDTPVLYLATWVNYAAWLLGELPRLAALDAVEGLGVLVHGPEQDFHRESLAMLLPEASLPQTAWLREPVRCQELYFLTPTYFHHTPSSRGLRFLNARMPVVQACAPGSSEGTRIYLSREHQTKVRPIFNEPDIRHHLERRGFIGVAPETLSFRDQVGLISQAQWVAGPFGANLANLALSRNLKGALLLATKHTPEFSRLLSLLGVPHRHVCGDSKRVQAAHTFSKSFGFRFEPSELDACLDALGCT